MISEHWIDLTSKYIWTTKKSIWLNEIRQHNIKVLFIQCALWRWTRREYSIESIDWMEQNDSSLNFMMKFRIKVLFTFDSVGNIERYPFSISCLAPLFTLHTLDWYSEISSAYHVHGCESFVDIRVFFFVF